MHCQQNDDEFKVTESDNIKPRVKEVLPHLPTKPGIYQFKNDKGAVIYVGKAKNLRNRVSQYFHQGRLRDAKTVAMISKICDVETIVTDSEAEALLLENNLIKELKPRYNILLKDDKSYPYIRVTKEEFPRVFSTRKVIRDGSRYFGPYTDGRYLSYLLETIRTMFPIRSCDLPLTDESIEKKKYKVCLDFHIKRCEGPCEGFVSQVHYMMHIRSVVSILSGQTKELERNLEQEMVRAAEDLRFEYAAELRNRLKILKEYVAKQKIMSSDDTDRDIFALSRDDEDACVVVFNVREGKMIGKRHFYIGNSMEQSESEIIRQTVEKWYLDTDMIPEEIILEEEIESADTLASWLEGRRGTKIEITIPKIGDKRKLINLAKTNAEFLLRDLHLHRAARENALPRGVAALQRDLRLQKPPRRIECFDNSHIQGSDYVSSMVCFVDGKPKKNDYRRFKLKAVHGNDDFAAMREVVERRYTRVIEEKTEMPDLIIIDGGKGQLSAAVEVLQELGVYPQIPVIGLAKRLEEVFFPNQSESILLPRTSTGLRLIQSLRDEAHRFAIEYHRTLRDKRTFQTELTTIDGIGEKTAQKLLITFGSVERVKNADRVDLEKAVGIKTTDIIRKHFGLE